MEKNISASFKDDRQNTYHFEAIVFFSEKDIIIKKIKSLKINDTIKIKPNSELISLIYATLSQIKETDRII